MHKLKKRIFSYIFLLFLLFGYQLFSQETEMNGTIVDSKNQKPIEFVNIGVLYKNQGTISNSNGEFTLTLSKNFKNDSLTISHVNFYSVKIPVARLESQLIYLEPKTTELAEVIVSNKKKRTRKTGVKSYSRLLSMRVISKSNDIIEAAQRIKIPSKAILIKAVNFNIRKWSKVDGVNVRINFYKNVDNAPGEKIIHRNIVHEIPLKTELGWIGLDLSDHGIYITQDFFVGIEFIPNFKTPTIVDLGCILSKGKGYSRENSLGSWGKLNGGASINVEIEY